jgi:copper chaperone
MENKMFQVRNISCRHCVMTIERELGELAGVTKVSGDVESKTVSVEWQDPATEEKIKTLLAEINYPAA